MQIEYGRYCLQLTRNERIFPTTPTGTKIGKYALFIPSPVRKVKNN